MLQRRKRLALVGVVRIDACRCDAWLVFAEEAAQYVPVQRQQRGTTFSKDIIRTVHDGGTSKLGNRFK